MRHRIITSRPHGKDLVHGSKRHLGGLPIQQGGQWDEFLPETDKVQNFAVEPQCCASAGTLHCIEILLKKLYNI